MPAPRHALRARGARQGARLAGRQPVLKGKVQRWLAQCAEVMAFAQASGPQGGAGALVVLLAGHGHRGRQSARHLPVPAADHADPAGVAGTSARGLPIGL
jgi:hypothetical protein